MEAVSQMAGTPRRLATRNRAQHRSEGWPQATELRDRAGARGRDAAAARAAQRAATLRLGRLFLRALPLS